MGVTGLATAQSTRPVHPPSPRFEPGARAQARLYALGRTLHSTGLRHFRLFEIQFVVLSFLDLLVSHCNIGVSYCRPSCKKRGGAGKRWNKGLSRTGRTWSTCFSTCKVLARRWVSLCHRSHTRCLHHHLLLSVLQ